MSVETVNKLKEVFDLFDYDHSGQVSIEEIHDVIKTLGLENEARNIISIIQSSTTAEELDFKAFLDIFGQSENQTEASLQQLYEVFDPNGTNCFGPEDFEKVCDMVGERFTPQEVDQMIDYADKDRDGGINFEEFVATIKREYPKV
jgi:Ca2+-binding EF-hand superfamily protein